MITKKAEYAIRTLVELACREKGVKTTCRAIAQRRRIPANLIVQLVSILRDGGLVDSRRGPSGGVELTRDPGLITLRQVIELVDGPIGITRCLTRDRPCNGQADCRLRGVWFEAQQKMLEVLERVTIRDLAESG